MEKDLNVVVYSEVDIDRMVFSSLFAASLLIPASKLTEYLKVGIINVDVLATIFGVSKLVMEQRIKDLKSPDNSESIRRVRRNILQNYKYISELGGYIKTNKGL